MTRLHSIDHRHDALTGGRAIRALDAIRITVAILILTHGVYRAGAGIVGPFGQYLEAQGFPMGIAFAWAVTAFEWVGPVLILARRYVTLAAIGHVFILTLGLVMVHAPAGWFVVGAGRNGVEYSVLLIASLLALAWAHRPAQWSESR
jgi:putative oxidoreductase